MTQTRFAMYRLGALVLAALLAGCAGSELSQKPAVAMDNSSAEAGTGTRQPPPPATPPAESTTGSADILPANPEESIFFLPGSSAIAATERHKLTPLAARLQADRRLTVTLVAHTNDYGSRSFNLAIADARIGTVIKALKKQGVAAYQIRKRAGSDQKETVNCRTPECWRSMRRVDFVFHGPAHGH